MIKARHAIIHPSPAQAILLKATQQQAAWCWNDIVSLAKAHYDFTHTWISKGDLQKKLKRTYKLHSQTVQALADKFCDSRQAAASYRKNGNLKMKYPWRIKKFLTIPFKQMAIKASGRRIILLTLSSQIQFDTGVIPPSPVRTCEILWRKGRYVLVWTSDYIEPAPIEGIIGGIDIGEIHPVALCGEYGHGLVVSGREIRSIKQLRNKSLAWFSVALSRCMKRSRRYKKLIRARWSLISKTDDQLLNLYHQVTRKAINYCIEKGIAELIIGDPAGVEKNTKKEKRLSRKSRQKVSQMGTGTIKKHLEYKAKEAGIATCFVGERNTSKECPACGELNHPRGRVYRCSSCGFEGHRDGKAAFMMIRKKYPDTTVPVRFRFEHKQPIPKYRKAWDKKGGDLRMVTGACVDGPDVVPRVEKVLGSSAIARPLGGESIAA
ncbi:MAG: transposase [Syntrophorhabdales bacterium]|jgi:putative transposase